MFAVVMFIEGKRAHEAALRDALLMQAVTTLKDEPRCHRFDVAADPLESASFLIYAVFSDGAAYKAHQETQHYANYAILIEPWTVSKRTLTYDLISELLPSAPAAPTHPGGHA